ncbi:MAG: type IV pilus biogenesis/stability protein PilW [Pseudomonadota bacterium]
MQYLYALMYFCLLAGLSGCGPMAAVGAIGSTITNASYNAAERDLNNPKSSRGEQAFQVAKANYNVAVEYFRQGENEKALEKLERSIAAKRDFAPAYNLLGLLYQRLRQSESAEESFKKAIDLDESDASAFNNYGLFLCSLNRRDEADEIFQRAANNPLYQTPEIALTNNGVCQLKENMEKARDYFVLALSKNKDFAPALIEMAELAYMDREYDLANDYFQRYRRFSRQNPRSLWLGIRISQKIRQDDNLASYKLLLRNQYPDSEEARLLQQSTL